MNRAIYSKCVLAAVILSLAIGGGIALAKKIPPEDLPGTKWGVLEVSKLKVKKAGKDRSEQITTIDVVDETTWTAVNEKFEQFAGTYAPGNRKATKFNLEFDEASLGTLEGSTADWIERILEANGLSSEVDVQITEYRATAKFKELRKKGPTMWLNAKFKFFATALALGETRKGTLRIKSKGHQVGGEFGVLSEE